MRRHPEKLQALAQALLAGGGLGAKSAAQRLAHTLGARRPRPWIEALARRYHEAFSGRTRPRQRDVITFLETEPVLRRLLPRVRIGHWIAEPLRMQPVPAAREWALPAIESTAALAAWLGLSLGELEWYADPRRLCLRAGLASPLHHYFYRAIVKPAGGVRLVEAPKPMLKMLQHRILHGILSGIPAHDAAHGFRRGRSVHSFAAPHVGQSAVLRMDLADFFPSIPAARVQALFRTAGYPERVADLLGWLCTNATPRAAWGRPAAANPEALVDAIRLHEHRHVPQGAPSSPALANLCAYRLDCRLAGLAAAAGATYTRYADDLAFSGNADLARGALRFAAAVAAIVREEGFAVNHRKTRLMRQGTRQHLGGLVTNEKLNVARADYDALKATLHNCARHGAASQNRNSHPAFREHLTGRVAWVASVNPSRGARLRALLNAINWDAPA